MSFYSMMNSEKKQEEEASTGLGPVTPEIMRNFLLSRSAGNKRGNISSNSSISNEHGTDDTCQDENHERSRKRVKGDSSEAAVAAAGTVVSVTPTPTTAPATSISGTDDDETFSVNETETMQPSPPPPPPPPQPPLRASSRIQSGDKKTCHETSNTGIRLKYPSAMKIRAILKKNLEDFGLQSSERKSFLAADLSFFQQEWCQKGMAVSSSWYEENVTEEGHPKTPSSRMLQDWIRLAILPVFVEKVNVQEWSTNDFQRAMPKFNIHHRQLPTTKNETDDNGRRSRRGSSNSTQMSWLELEAHLAKFGVPDWNVPGVTQSEKQSLVKYLLDFKTFFVPEPKVVVEPPVQFVTPPEPKVKSPSKPKRKVPLATEIIRHPAKRRPFNTQIPPQRKHLGRKTIRLGQRKLLPEELQDGASTPCFFWETLGKTRSGDLAFSWSTQDEDENPIGYCEIMGRVYYESFVFQDTIFCVGDFVQIGHGTKAREVVKIVSAFQATKSFVGEWHVKNCELQNRGVAYLEVMPFHRIRRSNEVVLLVESEWNPNHVEGAPISLFVPFLSIEKMDVQCSSIFSKEISKHSKKKFPPTIALSPKQTEMVQETNALRLVSSFALQEWPSLMMATFKVLQKTPRISSRAQKQDDFTAITLFESDDSDEFDQDSHDTENVIVFDETALMSLIGLNEELDHPEGEMLMFSGQLVPPKSKESDKLYQHLCDMEDSMKGCVDTDSTLQGHVSSLRKEILLRTMNSRLSDYFDIFRSESGSNVGKCPAQLFPKVGFRKFKNKTQEMACRHVLATHDRRDVVIVAPCGSGKSMTFIMSALKAGGVNIVVEPLNSVIKTQVEDLKYLSDSLAIEQLFNEKEARSHGSLKAQDRMRQIANQVHSHTLSTTRPYLIFATPELIHSSLASLKDLAHAGVLMNISIDEADMIQNSRNVYVELLPELRRHCGAAKFTFLSGTMTSAGLFGMLPPELATHEGPPPTNRPSLYLHHRALADCLSFHVERKINDEQVANRITLLIDEYRRNRNEWPKCLVYCVTAKRCETMVNFLTEKGIRAVSVTGNETESNMLGGIIESYKKGEISVLCCTTVLGRGFHIPDIRFVFHAAVPFSLPHYIQEAGRAGRDGKSASCFLFFRAQDFQSVKRILQSGDNPRQIANIEDDISSLLQYCMSAQCRYTQLAQIATVNAANPMEQRCSPGARCDNCQKEKSNFSQLCQTVRVSLDTLVDRLVCSGQKISVAPGTSLTRDLIENLVTAKILEKDGKTSFRGGIHLKHFQQELKSGSLFCFIRTSQIESKPKKCDKPRQLKHYSDKVQDLEIIPTFGDNKIGETCSPLDRLDLPFLLRFEAERKCSTDREPSKRLTRQYNSALESQTRVATVNNDILTYLSNEAVTPITFMTVCKVVSGAKDFARYTSKNLDWSGNSLYFQAELILQAGKPHYRLMPPERVISGRRIFRRFGSHRFLHVKVHDSVMDDVLPFEEAIYLCGRRYRYFWCKAQKSPQCFVFFAEQGLGIDDNISVEELRDWCIPLALNAGLTIAKELKRLKLWFSKTIPSVILPDDSIELAHDIVSSSGKCMTDGAGLVSQGAINKIWQEYSKACNHDMSTEECPFSSFQGRIGGFKGVWVLDQSLGDDVAVVCRPSQHKFNLPMSALKGQCKSISSDPFYNAVEINSWDEYAEKGYLNVALVQILEHRGVSLDYFKGCADNGLEWLDEVSCEKPGGENRFFDEILKRHRFMVGSSSEEPDFDKGDDMLYRMAAAQLDPNEPYYTDKRRRFIKNNAEKMRSKARYPTKDSFYLRMIPDHIQLLDEGEAFLAIENNSSLCKAKEVLVFRNPSYFVGDLRKLKLVNYDELILRAMKEGGRKLVDTCTGFFGRMRYGLVLSTKGEESEADRLSGGDFDGDKAWVCFDPELVVQVSIVSPPVRPPPVANHAKEAKLASEATIKDRLRFARHFKYHQGQLGLLANTLTCAMDQLGEDDEQSTNAIVDIANQAFLQVDHPYRLCKMKLETQELLNNRSLPHWRQNPDIDSSSSLSSSTYYTSKKVMGILWDYVEVKINAAVKISGLERSTKNHITEFIAPHTPNLAGLTDISRQAIQEYRVAMKLVMDEFASFPDKVSKEKDKLIRKYRNQLIEQTDKSFEERVLAAAVLYQQCDVDRKEFAWNVADDYLLHLVARFENKAVGRLPPCMTHNREIRAFGRRGKGE